MLALKFVSILKIDSSCSYCLVTEANGVRLELNCVRLDVVSNCFIEMFFWGSVAVDA